MKSINLFKNKYKHTGMLTVEATLIFPLIFFILFGIIYLSIILYQNAVMTTESLRAMNRIGAYYQYLEDNDKDKDKKTPKAFDNTIDAKDLITVEDLKNRNKFRSILDLLPDDVSRILFNMTKTQRFEIATEFVRSRQSNLGFDILAGKEGTNGAMVGQFDRDDHLFFGDAIRIDITKNYINPLSKSIDQGLQLNMDDFAKNNIVVTGIINKNSEFVRDIDAIYEIANKYVDWSDDEKTDDEKMKEEITEEEENDRRDGLGGKTSESGGEEYSGGI